MDSAADGFRPRLCAADHHGLDLRRAGYPDHLRRHRGGLAAGARGKIRRHDGAGICAGATGTCADELLKGKRASRARAPSAADPGARRPTRAARSRRTTPHQGLRTQVTATMNADAERQVGLDDAIMVDEIGIESGGYGIYRLRSLYQPIFERRDQFLQAVAVEGTVAPYVAGEEAPPEMFLAAVAEDDRDFVEQM